MRHLRTSLTRISDLGSVPYEIRTLPRGRWGTGDYVLVEVTTRVSGRRVELTSGRMTELTEGDLVVGALGHRHATLELTGTWRAVGEGGRLEVLTGGGLLGRCTSASMVLPPPASGVYRGHVTRGDEPLGMGDFVPDPPPPRPYRIPTVLIIGTSMSAGKTTAGRILVRRLKALGKNVVGAKLTGAGRYRDILTFADAGADAVYDFVDAGLPSTICPEDRYRARIRTVLSLISEADCDVAVVEIGASPLEPYNGSGAISLIEEGVAMTVLCASDPYAVLGVGEAFGREPDLVTGIASNTDAGVELVEKLTGLTCLNVRDKDTLPALDRLLRSRLEGP